MLGRLVVLVLVAIACKKNPTPPAPTPATAADVETFAAAYVRAKSPCDQARVGALVDLDTILARAIQNTTYSRAMVDGMRRGLGRSPVLCNPSLGAKLSIRYLRAKTVDGTPRPLFRLVGEHGFTYELLELDKRGDTVVAVDLYNYASGLRHSAMFRNLIAAFDDNDRAASQLIKQMNQHKAEGRFGEAHDAFKALPEKLRSTRELMVNEVVITSNLDEATALDAMDRFTKAFPGDPAMLLVEIGMQLLHKKYDKALAAIDRVDKDVGGDPYLDVLRAEVYQNMGKPDDALAAAKRATTAEPTLEEAWWQLLVVQAAGAKFADATVTLTALRKLTKVDRATLAADERFKELVASAELAAWEQAQPK